MLQILGQTPGLLIVSSISGLATMVFGFLMLATPGEKEKRNTRTGTWLFLVGLAISLIAVITISTTQ